MKQNNKKYKNKQMRRGFTMIELMFVIMLLIALAFIAQKTLLHSKDTGILASQVSDFKNAAKLLNDYPVSSGDMSSNSYYNLLKNDVCSAYDKDDSGFAGDADGEIYCNGHYWDANTFPIKFPISEDNRIQFKSAGAGKFCYKLKVVTGNMNVEHKKEVFQDFCTMNKPEIRDSSTSWTQ